MTDVNWKTYDPTASPLGIKLLEYVKKNPGQTAAQIRTFGFKDKVPGTVSGMISQMVRVKAMHYRVSEDTSPSGHTLFCVYPGKSHQKGRQVRGHNLGVRSNRAGQKKVNPRPKVIQQTNGALVSVETTVQLTIGDKNLTISYAEAGQLRDELLATIR